MNRTSITNTVFETMNDLGITADLCDTDQINLFEM